MYIRKLNLNVTIRTILIILFILAFVFIPSNESNIKASNLVLVLDPGHGGTDPGALYYYDGIPIKEAELNMKIALAARQVLLKYEGVTIHLTREDSKYLALDERVNIAASLKADAIISIHNNASTSPTAHGAEVMVPSGNDGSGLHLISKALGDSILDELTGLGIHRRGLMQRISSTYTYKNGKQADYYGIIRHSMNNSLPGIIVECAFLSNENDYRTYLNTNEKLVAIGQAIARGIANYYGLVEGDSFQDGLGDINEDTFISAYDAYLLNKQIGTELIKDRIISDVNGDGLINSEDVKEILEYSAKLREEFSGGKTQAINKPDQILTGIIKTTEDDPYLNVRTGPSISYPAIGAFDRGSTIYIISGQNDNWCYARGICVNTGKIIEGYSSMAYINVIEKEEKVVDFEVSISGPSISVSSNQQGVVTSGCFSIQFDSEKLELEGIESEHMYVKRIDAPGVVAIYLINITDSSKLLDINFVSKDSGASSEEIKIAFSELTDVEGASLVAESKFVTFTDTTPLDLDIVGEYVYGFPSGMTVSDVLSKYRQIKEIYLNNGENAYRENLLGTGMKIKVNDSVYIVVIFGDVNGDGVIDVKDIESIQKHLLEVSVLEDAYFNAADLNRDEYINALDIAFIQKNIYESAP